MRNNIKNSYGIALCRRGKNNEWEVIFVKKKCTYNFLQFVYGMYDILDGNYMNKLFNGMTFQEKVSILTFNFDILWNAVHFHLSMPGDNNLSAMKREARKTTSKYLNYKYFKSKMIFNGSIENHRNRIIRLIKTSQNRETLWEIPKGRKEEEETDIDAAVREMKEETNIGISEYNILWDCSSVCESYKDFGITYNNFYYLATLKNDHNKEKKFMQEKSFDLNIQTFEVEAIRWLSITKIKSIVVDDKIQKRIVNLLKRIFRKLKKHNKIW
jgi:8-oxo-dGTP pyrophosphatase MutT (NUDIX family)